MTNKEYIAQRVNKNCTRASCLLCAEADKYPSITIAHISPLKKSLATGP